MLYILYGAVDLSEGRLCLQLASKEFELPISFAGLSITFMIPSI